MLHPSIQDEFLCRADGERREHALGPGRKEAVHNVCGLEHLDRSIRTRCRAAGLADARASGAVSLGNRAPSELFTGDACSGYRRRFRRRAARFAVSWRSGADDEHGRADTHATK